MDKISKENLPFISSALPGIGGDFKTTLESFKVIELPLYEPCGKGEHVYLRLTKKGADTQEIVKQISSLLKIQERDIGTAGLKDKQSISTQMFSIYMPNKTNPLQIKEKITSNISVTCDLATRHTNKLKTGHLRRNRFEIYINNTLEGALQRSYQKWNVLEKTGIPNYYGEQRFGRNHDNAIRGKELLLGKRKEKHWLQKFLLSAYQSELFNQVLSQRVKNNNFTKLYKGDIAVKNQSGGLFLIDSVESEKERFECGEISFTCPMFGKKMKPTEYQVLQWENSALNSQNVTLEDFSRAGLNGTRRSGRFFLENFSVIQFEQGLIFKFDLPPGCYASIVMQEFM